jgi:hypothetical protein
VHIGSGMLLFVVMSAGLCSGCAGKQTRDTTAPPTARDVISGSELARSASGSSVLVALRLTRPWFLASRGSTPVVSIDGSPPVELSLLSAIPVTDVIEVRLLRATSGAGRVAVLPNGDTVVGDVLLVITRSR